MESSSRDTRTSEGSSQTTVSKATLSERTSHSLYVPHLPSPTLLFCLGLIHSPVFSFPPISTGIHRSPLRRREETGCLRTPSARPGLQELRGSPKPLGAGRSGCGCETREVQNPTSAAAKGGKEMRQEDGRDLVFCRLGWTSSGGVGSRRRNLDCGDREHSFAWSDNLDRYQWIPHL